jgi:hypothetical protein
MSPQLVACVADSAEADESEARFAFAVPIATPSPQIRAYLKMFQCIAVIVYDDGRVSVSRDPFTPKHAPIAGVWWVSSPAQALAIKERCEAEEHSTSSLLQPACAYQSPATPP